MAANNQRRRKKDSARLVWDTKPRRAPNPRDIEFQTAEVVIPNPARDVNSLPLSFRDGLFGNEELDKQQMNRLIWGDNLLAMQALLAQGYEGKVDLIYIDPPFASSEDYYHGLRVGGVQVTKAPSVLERLAYSDFWAGGIDSYLDMLYPRLQLMKRLLSEHGAIFVHLDWRVNSYVRVMLDEVFGRESFRNEVIWRRAPNLGRQAAAKQLGRVIDTIYVYSKAAGTEFRGEAPVRSQPYPKDRAGKPRGAQWDADRGLYFTTAPRGDYTDDSIARLREEGRVHESSSGQVYIKYFLRKGDDGDWYKDQPADTLWDDPGVKPLRHCSQDELGIGYDTQKPEGLLTRIVSWSTQPGDLVADLFCGSGTALVAAERLGRRWIGCDFGKVPVQIARTRLVEAEAKPFLIENIGNYQREMIYLTGGRIGEMQRVILKLYGATPRPRTNDLGTRQADDGVLELVYCGYPDRPVTARKAEELARQAEALDGTGYRRLVILAWDYEYNYSTALENRLKASKRAPRVRIESRFIPPDIYDYLKKAKDEDDLEPLRDKIVFHEKPYLRLAAPKAKRNSDGTVEVTIGIDRYVLFDIPVQKQEDREQLLALAKDNFAALIDYWAVDWDYDGYTFKSQWQALRGNGRRTRVVPTTVTHTLPKGKAYTIAVRLVDVFGNDAAGTVEVELLR